MANIWTQAKRQSAATPDRVLRLFEDDFEPSRSNAAAPKVAVAPTEPTAPPPTLADVEAAHAEGLRLGAISAEAAATRQTEATLQVLLAELATLGADSRQTTEAAATAIAVLLLAMLKRFFPVLSERFGAAEAAAAARTVLAGLHNEPEVIIRGSAATIRELERLFALHPTDGPTKLTLVPTDAMPTGDVAMRWREGHALRDTDRLWRDVTEALGLHGLTEPQTRDTQRQEPLHG